MHITAIVSNSRERHEVAVETDGSAKTLAVPGGQTGYGSYVNGGDWQPSSRSIQSTNLACLDISYVTLARTD